MATGDFLLRVGKVIPTHTAFVEPSVYGQTGQRLCPKCGMELRSGNCVCGIPEEDGDEEEDEDDCDTPLYVEGT